MGIPQRLHFKWDDSAVELLKQLCADPTKPSAAQIAARMQLPRNAVIGKVHRLGIALPGKGKRGVHVARVRKIMRTAGLAVDPIPPAKAVKRQRLTNRGTRFTMDTVTEYEQPGMTAGGIEPLNIALLDLTSGQCRWPYGDQAPYFFCGHPQDYASSYCPFHADMASSRGTPGERSVAPYIPPRRRAA